MRCELSEEDLWNGIDSGAPDVAEHLTRCPTCRSRAAEFRQGIAAVVTASTPTAPPLPESIGPYTIKRRLGEGGMGIVYEGEQSNPQRPVAIKVVRGGHTADDFRIRLLKREAQTLARLKHPSIAAIYEAGRTEGGQDYFAMELVRGVPLGEHVRQRKLPRRQRLVLIRRICEAINYAHQRGVIHRDIKPSNILIDSDGNPKILDFGLARIQDPESTLMTTVTDMGRLMGTLPYMSPEEARGSADEIDVRSDVYSLGVILYELLTDRLPYDVTGVALHEAVGIVCEQRPLRPGAIDRSLRGDLETVVLKALAKERGRRYQSAAALAEDIARFLTDKPILGRRSSVVYQLRKFVARHRLFVLFAAASILLVSGARMWMVRLAAGDRQQIVRNIELLEIREASIENQLAAELHEAGKYVRAEPHYRNALATFLRLDQPERAGPALVALATLFLERREPTAGDLELAEEFFLDALAIFDRHPVDFDVQRKRALSGLLKLYGPDVWDDAESFDKIHKEIDDIEAAKNAPQRPPAK